MILDSTTDSLDVVLGVAITTNQLPFTVSFNDYTSSAVTPTKNVSVTNSTSAVNLIAAPAASHQRQLRYCSVFNADTVSAAVTIRFNNNGTNRNVIVCTLLINESIQYTCDKGWRVFDANGAEKVTGFLLGPGAMRMTEYFAAANNTTVLTTTSGTDYCFYLGKADKAYSSISIAYRTTTALGATITWAELAIYKGTPTIAANVSLTPRCGFTDCSAIFNQTAGTYTTAVAVTGINAGDDLWVVFGSVTNGTNMIVRAGLVDDVGAGFIQTLTGSVRPSLNNTLSPTLQNATNNIWAGWQGI